jgi:hypothetical protein
MGEERAQRPPIVKQGLGFWDGNGSIVVSTLFCIEKILFSTLKTPKTLIFPKTLHFLLKPSKTIFLMQKTIKTHFIAPKSWDPHLLRIDLAEQSDSRSWGFPPAARTASPLREVLYIILRAYSAHPPAPAGLGGWGAGAGSWELPCSSPQRRRQTDR